MLLRKLIGILLLLAAIVGLFFSIAGVVLVWRVEQDITTGLQTSIDLVSQTLDTTAEGLIVTREALGSSIETIGALETTIETIAKTIKSTTPMVDEISLLMETNLPESIQATQTSLRSAQQSAKVIDSLLSTLSGIPLIGSGLNYNPQVPLSDSLGQVADSLKDLPGSFRNVQQSLAQTTSNLETFEADVTFMAESISNIEASVSQYDAVIEGYQKSLKQIHVSLEAAKSNLPTYVHFLVLALTVFFVWMAIAQLGLLTQGWELVTESPGRAKPLPEKQEDEVEKEAKTETAEKE